ncbi:hypothetical protein Pcinc_025911 [Petrolisthes cinctipes]|uniref:Uncharacterized protein n=1 Tax=Petrolisthes cinctipes TaxID=88211 RepID=A0AAE1F9L1_PETCI|nr:hypothetical protein Pcinc_025911 [Petrolisthes cinctipes]
MPCVIQLLEPALVFQVIKVPHVLSGVLRAGGVRSASTSVTVMPASLVNQPRESVSVPQAGTVTTAEMSAYQIDGVTTARTLVCVTTGERVSVQQVHVCASQGTQVPLAKIDAPKEAMGSVATTPAPA